MKKQTLLAFLLILIFTACAVDRKPYLLDMQDRYSHKNFIQDEEFLTKYEYQRMYSQVNNMLNVYIEIQTNIESSKFSKKELAKIDYMKAYRTLDRSTDLYINTIKDYPRALQSAKTALFFAKKGSSSNQNIYSKMFTIYQKMNNSSKSTEYKEKSLAISKEGTSVSSKKDMVTVQDKYKGNYKELIQANSKFQEAQKRIELSMFTKEQLKKFPYQKAYKITYKSSKIYIVIGDFPRALESAQNALFYARIISKQKESTQTIQAYNRIADIYQKSQDYAKALEYAKKAISASKGGLLLSTAYSTQSSIYRSMNLYPKAIKSMKEAISIAESSKRKPSELRSYYIKLSQLHRLNSDKSQARIVSKKVSKIPKADLTSLQKDAQKAVKYEKEGKYNEAIKYLKKVVARAEERLGREHYMTANFYGKMSLYYLASNQPKKALPYTTKVLRIHKKIFGKYHFKTAKNYLNLSIVYLKMDKIEKAYFAMKESVKIILESREKLFSQLNKQEKFENEQYNIGHFFYIAYLYQEKYYGKREKIAKEAFNIWLRYKGEINNSEAYLISLKSKTDNIEVKSKINNLIEIRKDYSNLFMKKISNEDKFLDEDKIKRLEDKKEHLESYLSSKILDYKESLKLKKINSYQISQKLQKDEVYIDFVHIKHNNSYFSFILNHKNQVSLHLINPKGGTLVKAIESIVGILLGGDEDNSYASVDTLVNKLREDIKKGKKSFDKSNAEKLYSLLLFEPSLDNSSNSILNAKKLIISPDGVLNLLPFEVLINYNDKYLIEEKEIRYISSGKEFLRAYQHINKISKSDKIVVLANLDYDKSGIVSRNIESKEENKLLSSLMNSGTLLTRLKYTKDEGLFMQNLFGRDKVSLYSNREGTKKLLFSLKAPKILHLSTHSFYGEDKNTNIEPLLKSAMALSGYNRIMDRNNPNTDGIISALEFSSLNLYDTDLVLFSSCKSAMGEIHSSDGVSSLNHGATLAGAKRVISTLWSVADRESVELTKNFYRHLKQNKMKGYADVLKKTKLEMIDKNMNPFYWAGFIEYGID